VDSGPAADTAADPAWAGISDDGCARARAGLPFSLPEEDERQATRRDGCLGAWRR
jgi:hypothetical protein